MVAITFVFVLALPLALVTFTNPPVMINSMDSTFVRADQEDLPTRGNLGMVYDNESDLVVIFSGWNNTDDPWNSTWIYDYNSDEYAELNPSVSPPGRAEPGMTYDSIRDQVILFGGEDNMDTPRSLNDTWTFDVDTNTWTEVFPTIAPLHRRGQYMAFDSESDRVILFGGRIGWFGSVVNDTWSFNPATNEWQMMSPAIAPPGRFSNKMVYDSESDRMILFGGHNGGSTTYTMNYFGDTWAYDFNSDTWENIATTTQPSRRVENSLTYDSESDRIVLFGGSMFVTTYEDTWLFDYNTMEWTNVVPSDAPSQRSRHGSAYDWESDRVIIYSGTQNGVSSTNFVSGDYNEGKTWAYDVNTNTWERMNQGVDPPVPTTTTTTTTNTTTSTTTPPPVDGQDFLMWAGVGGVGVVLILVVIFLRKK